MTRNRTITVFGAYGHTGRFVVAELRKRGWKPILCGRDAEQLDAMAATHPEQEVRAASINDPASLDRALVGAAAVINCAGPFLDTATPIIEAALRARVHYLDLAAEQGAVLDAFSRFSGAARDAGVVVLPGMAFYGGLGDLLATAAMRDWRVVDDIEIAVGLDSWLPTRGTRLTGERNTVQRVVVSNNRLEPISSPPGTRTWTFAAPFGEQEVVEVPLSEIILISRHVHSAGIHSYMNLAPLQDLRNPATPAPTATDDRGRSAQVFLLDVLVRKGSEERRAMARGRDIYAITGPLVVEAAIRLVERLDRPSGVVAAGEIFGARDFLDSLAPDLNVEIS